VYSIPLAVKANAGIPLGTVSASSEKPDIFSIFADLLAENGSSRDDRFRLPLMSDVGTALRSYEEGLAGRAGYHQCHDLCYRRLLESLGSRMLVALRARHLFFTTTEKAFRELRSQC
jgi:hypothetical protein